MHKNAYFRINFDEYWLFCDKYTTVAKNISITTFFLLIFAFCGVIFTSIHMNK